MRFEKINTAIHPMYARALEVYKQSFPWHEQREEISQKKLLSEKAYNFTLIYDETEFVGLVLYWEAETYIYIEHLCIAPEFRNRHYGQLALAQLADSGKLLILEIDPPVDDISVRRKSFYERCGFVESPFPHVHPPYHRDVDGHELLIMSSPRELQLSEYLVFREYLYTEIMRNVF